MKDLTKLPKWAQDKIKKLELNDKFLRRELSEALGTYPKSNTRVYKYSYPDVNHINLVDHAVIEFDSITGPVKVNVDLNGAVRVDIGIEGYIYPIARNVFEVYGKGR